MISKSKNPWQVRYGGKTRTPEEAVSVVRPGQRVFVGSGAAEPQTLVEALSACANIPDTQIVHILTLGVATYAEPKFGDQFRHNADFIGPNVRGAVVEGRADYTPVCLSEIPALFRTGRVVIDVAVIEVSTPDEHGCCIYGVSTDIVKGAAESGRGRIGRWSGQMRAIHGGRGRSRLNGVSYPGTMAARGSIDRKCRSIRLDEDEVIGVGSL